MSRRAPPPAPRRSRPARPSRLSPTAWLWIAAGALFAVVGGLVGLGLFDRYYVPPRETVLKVGDRSFKMSYFVDRARYFIADTGSRGLPTSGVDALTSTLDEMEQNELVRQAAASEGLVVSDEELDEALRDKVAVLSGRTLSPEIAANRGAGTNATATPTAAASPGPSPAPFADDTDFLRALGEVQRTTGLSKRKLREIVRAETLWEKLREKIGGEIAAEAPQVQILAIVVRTREQADDAKERLDGGEKFEALQEELSPQTMPPTVPASPPLPWSTREMLIGSVAEAAFSTPVGEYSDVVTAGGGFAIVKVVARDAARPLDELQRQFHLSISVNDWLSERRRQVEVVRKLDPDKLKWALDRISG